MGHIDNTEPLGPYSESRAANAYCVSLLRELTELEIKTHCPGPDIQQVLNKGYKTKKGEHPAVDVANLCEAAQALGECVSLLKAPAVMEIPTPN